MRETMPTKKIEEAEEVTRCPECNSGHLSFDYERGELICEECGLVLTDQMIDQGPEWRAFDVEQGERDGFAAKRPRDRRDGLPEGREQEPDPRSLDRRRGRGVPLCRVPSVQRPADPRRDRELVPRRAQGNRPDVPLHDAGTETETHAHE